MRRLRFDPLFAEMNDGNAPIDQDLQRKQSPPPHHDSSLRNPDRVRIPREPPILLGSGDGEDQVTLQYTYSSDSCGENP